MPSQPPDAAIAALESLLNTADRYNDTDALAEVGAGGRRLRSAGLLTVEDDLDAAGLRTVREVREDLRQLAAANTEQRPPPPSLVDAVDRRLGVGRLRLDLRAGERLEAVLHPAASQPALDSVLAVIAAAVYDTVRADVWARVKACANDDCQWAFYDRSRSRTGRWCDMRACGNLLKARAYRRRRQDAASS